MFSDEELGVSCANLNQSKSGFFILWKKFKVEFVLIPYNFPADQDDIFAGEDGICPV